MVCWVTRGSLHQHVTAHQPFRTSSLTSPCKSCLQGRVVSHPEPNSFLGRRKTLCLRKRDIFSKIQGPSKKQEKQLCPCPEAAGVYLHWSPAGGKADVGSAAPCCPDFAWEISELSTPRGNFFLQSQSLPIFVDPKNGEWNPLLFIIQKPLTRFWHKASLAQSRAHGQLENIPEPFNNPWLVFKLKTKAKIRESLQIFRLYKKISAQPVINSHHLFSVIFMLGEFPRLQTLLLPWRA